MSNRRQIPSGVAYPLQGKGPDGAYPCRVCKAKPARLHFRTCSAECSHIVALTCSAGTQRYAVEKRDKGVCVECHGDMLKLERVFDVLKRKGENFRAWGHNIWPTAEGRIRKDMNFRSYGALWDMAHIRDVADGGGIRPGMAAAEILGNLRTLCTPCHKAETKRRSVTHA